MNIPAPECKYGFTRDQVEDILQGARLKDFDNWCYGQTMMLCTGVRYNHDEKKYEASGCDEAHGPVVYPWDFERFLAGGEVVD